MILGMKVIRLSVPGISPFGKHFLTRRAAADPPPGRKTGNFLI
jgi:hypothetical protein